MSSAEQQEPHTALRGWLTLLVVWVLVLPLVLWWSFVHALLNIPYHPRWNIPATTSLIVLAFLAWGLAVRLWMRSEAVYGSQRVAASSVALAVRGIVVGVLSCFVLAAAGGLCIFAWQFDGDSSGRMRIEAHYVIRSVRADLQLHNASDGDLSDLRSGPVIDSRLLSGRKTISGEWLSTDLRRWAPGNFYLEIHGEPPSYKGTVIYAKGAYWPYDDSAPWFKDYRMVVTDLQEPDGYTFEVVWSE